MEKSMMETTEMKTALCLGWRRWESRTKSRSQTSTPYSCILVSTVTLVCFTGTLFFCDSSLTSSLVIRRATSYLWTISLSLWYVWKDFTLSLSSTSSSIGRVWLLRPAPRRGYRPHCWLPVLLEELQCTLWRCLEHTRSSVCNHLMYHLYFCVEFDTVCGLCFCRAVVWMWEVKLALPTRTSAVWRSQVRSWTSRLLSRIISQLPLCVLVFSIVVQYTCTCHTAGPVLPSSLHAILTLLRPAQKGNFSAALYTHTPTAVMNIHSTKQQVTHTHRRHEAAFCLI